MKMLFLLFTLFNVFDVFWCEQIKTNNINKNLDLVKINSSSILLLDASHSNISVFYTSFINRKYFFNETSNINQTDILIYDEISNSFIFRNQSFTIMNDSISIESTNEINFTIYLKANITNTSDSYNFIIYHFNGTLNISSLSENKSYVLYNNDFDFTITLQNNYILQSFLQNNRYLVGNVLMLFGLYMLFFGTVTKFLSFCFLCICGICSIIEEMSYIITQNKIYPKLIGEFVIIASIIFGSFVSLFIYYYSKRYKLFILISTSSICLVKILILFLHYNSAYIFLYIISIISGVVITVYHGKYIQNELDKYKLGLEENNNVSISKKVLIIIAILSSIIIGYIITSGLIYEVGGIYYWKMYNYKDIIRNKFGLEMQSGNCVVYLIVFIFFVGIAFMSQFCMFHLHLQEIVGGGVDSVEQVLQEENNDRTNESINEDTNNKMRIKEDDDREDNTESNQFSHGGYYDENGE